MTIPVWAFYAVLGLAILLLIYQLHKTLEDDQNDLQWWQFISSRGRDGKQYADLTKLGQASGILICFFSIILLADKVTTDAGWLGFSAVLSVVLLYLGGVQAYQTFMKTRTNANPITPDKPKEDKDA